MYNLEMQGSERPYRHILLSLSVSVNGPLHLSKQAAPAPNPDTAVELGPPQCPAWGSLPRATPATELHSLTHTSCSAQNLPLLLKYPNAACTALAANIPWARLAGCSSQRWGRWAQTAQGAWLAVSHSLWSRVNYVGERSSIAKPCAHHSDTILRVLIAWFIYLSQKPCLQQWKWISLSLPALPRSQQRLQCIYGLNCNLHRCKKYHPWNQGLSTEKGILRLTWASDRHAAMAKQMSISPGLILSASAFFMLRA